MCRSSFTSAPIVDTILHMLPVSAGKQLIEVQMAIDMDMCWLNKLRLYTSACGGQAVALRLNDDCMLEVQV